MESIKQKCIGRDNNTTPLERCWAIRNYIGATTGKFDVADEVGAVICDMMIPFMAHDKMRDNTDDTCTEYWIKTKEYLLGGR
jgi:hypothetical protein